jgi:hypothetical protein
MTVELRTPTRRECQQCGRVEIWDEDRGSWVVDGDAGDVYCIHGWDITGEFTPIRRS